MADFTSQAIKASFLKLLAEKPYNKITVKDIVSDCGINRNSFYYHYQDIPYLLEEIVDDEMNRMVQMHPKIDTFEKCVRVVLTLAGENKVFVLHVYNYVSREIFEQFLWKKCKYAVNIYMDTIYPEWRSKLIHWEDIERYFVCQCFGLVSGWLKDGMREEPDSFIAVINEMVLISWDKIREKYIV